MLNLKKSSFIKNYRLPTEEVADLKKKLNYYMTLNPRVYKHFEEYVTDNVHPMTALRTSVSYIAHFDPNAEGESEEKILERSIRIQAKVASLVTAFARVRDGKEPLKPKAELNYAGNFYICYEESYLQILKLRRLIKL